MASKFDSSQLTSGMTMGINFISALTKKLVEHGGNPLLIHQLTLPSGEERLDAIAKTIVAMHFPILRSQIEATTLEIARHNYPDDPEYQESDSKYAWGLVELEKTYGIPEVEFGDHDQDDPPIPDEVRKQILHKPLAYPLVIDYQGVPYVLTWLNTGRTDSNPLPGQVLEYVDRIGMAEAKYFDLDN